MVKLIALDLDGTTLNRDGKLCAENKSAIEKAIAAGIHVVIASGRAYSTLPADVLSVNGIEYAITGNGAAVYRLPTASADAEILHSSCLTPEAVENILSLVNMEKRKSGEQIMFEAFIRGAAFASAEYIENAEAYCSSAYAVEYVRKTRTSVVDMNGFMMEHRSELDSMDLVVMDQGLKRKLWEYISENIRGIYITSSIPQLLEISDCKAGKGNALKFLCDCLKLDRSETAAFGDADNDLEMIKFAGYGMAVGNACDNLKNAADRIVAANYENGVAEGIREIIGDEKI